MKSQAAIYAEYCKERHEQEEKLMLLYGRIFEHWRECPKGNCRRARGCRADLVACFRGWWRAMTEEERNELRTLLRAIIEQAQANGVREDRR